MPRYGYGYGRRPPAPQPPTPPAPRGNVYRRAAPDRGHSGHHHPHHHHGAPDVYDMSALQDAIDDPWWFGDSVPGIPDLAYDFDALERVFGELNIDPQTQRYHRPEPRKHRKERGDTPEMPAYSEYVDTGEILGEGAFGEIREFVRRVKGTADPRPKVLAVKMIKPGESRAIRQELRISDRVAKFDHENIVKYYGLFDYGKLTCFAYEKLECNLQEATDLRIRGRIPWTPREAAIITSQVLEGCDYLWRRHRVVHCDIKPDNIMFLDVDDLTVKLIDFGLSKRIDHRQQEYRLSGTPGYIAPERYMNIAAANSDVWSVMVTFREIIEEGKFHSSKIPPPSQAEEYFREYVRPKLLRAKRHVWSTEKYMYDFLEHMCKVRPIKRPTAEKARKHPFLVKYVGEYDIDFWA